MFSRVTSLVAANSARRGRSRRPISRRLFSVVLPMLLVASLGWHTDAVAWQLAANWAGSSGGVNGYSLERATGPGGTYAQIATTASGVITYTDSGVTAGTTYCYRARAFNGAGYSAYSNVVCAAPLATTITVQRQSTGQWWTLLPSGQIAQPTWGCVPCGDILVPADYDGDRQTDVAVFRPSNGTWYILRSSDGTLQQIQWGASGDVPVPGDFDGDGKADLAVFRPSTGKWYILRSSDNTLQQVQWGASGDVPIPADFDGDGKADLAVFRPSDGTWYVLRSRDGALQQITWGAAGDVPVPGDFDGDGKADLTVFRPSTGKWYILRSSDGTLQQIQWGGVGDQPVALRHR